MENEPLLDPRFSQVLLAFTNLCNLECKHCYLSSGPDQAYGLDIKRILHLCHECYDSLGRVNFYVSGGEPLMRLEDTLEILTIASQFHDTFLQTNATLITRSTAKELAATGSSIQVGFNGGSAISHNSIRGENAFSRSRRGITNLIEEGFPASKLKISATITPANIDEIYIILDYAKTLGVQEVDFEPVAKIGRAALYWTSPPKYPDPDTYPVHTVMKKLVEKGYFSGWRITAEEVQLRCLNIYFDGSVLPFTIEQSGPFHKSRGCIGNILEASLCDILASNRVSNAIIEKFLCFATNGPRILGTYKFFRDGP
jgi:MoaA/NifB/PqqE/SkfB family radical SAM enzyme